MHAVYRLWAINNVLIVSLFNNVVWEIKGEQELNKDSWYLLIANHQSWLDIVILADFACKKIAEPKFFLKDSLKKIPFLGMACWALDMPFMKRYSKSFIEKYPHLKGQDIETTKKSCQSFKDNPTTIINFVEGTRFTKAKHGKQESPFSHLLVPKAGGIAFTLAALGEQFDKVLNVTIVYPDNQGHIMMDVLKGKLKRVVIMVDSIDVDENIVGDYFDDTRFKQGFQQWLNSLWGQKDQLIASFYNK